VVGVTATDLDLLERLLGPRVRDAAAAYGCVSIRDLAALPPAVLAARLPRPQAARLEALRDLLRRYATQPWPERGAALTGAAAVYARYGERLAAAAAEEVWVVLLDNKHRVLHEELVSRGSLTASIVHPREVFAPVVRWQAAAMILVHNHPSGDPTPSREDLEITRRLRDVADVLGVRLLDHVVVGRGRYVSFVDDGYW